MSYKFNPFTGKLDVVNSSSSSTSIPQVDTDPASPSAEDAWVLKTTTGGAGGGVLQFFGGLGQPITSVGAPSTTYQFSYRTVEGTTKRVTLT